MKKYLAFLLTAVFFQASAAHVILAAQEEAEHGGDIIYTKPLKAVRFSHATHVQEAGLSCDSCHDGIFPMEALSVQENKDFTMDSLYKGKYCGACHDGSMAFASDTQCARCHIGVKGLERSQKKGK